MYRNQRRLLRGCHGIEHRECSSLKNFPPDEVVGFMKGSGAAGGGGKVGVHGEPQKGSFDDAAARAKMLDEFRYESKHLTKKDFWNDDEIAETTQKLQHLNESISETFDVNPFSEQVLFGTVFDTNGTEAAKALTDRLQRHGAIHRDV